MENLDVILDFDWIPDRHTCKGEDISPRIGVQGVKATSLAVVVEDPDAQSGTFTHWLIWNISPVAVIPEAIPNKGIVTKPIQALQGLNSSGEVGYMGPCPPPGKPHRYFFRVLGLDGFLNLRSGAARSEFEKAIEGRVVQKGEAMATYGL